MNNHKRALRGEVEGWSEGATRRNTEFLMSVREDRLDGVGFAVTLTLKDCPPNAAKWHALRRAWLMRMTRADMLWLHWVTEWQRRGVPHLHGALWFPQERLDRHGFAMLRAFVIGAWCELAADYRAGFRGQDMREIKGTVGWFQYLAKHAARGVQHYQRNPENIPEGWKSKTGRVWGKTGDWPVQASVRINLQDQHGDGGWFAYRRLVRSWRRADARASGDIRRMRSARSMLTCSDQALSRVRGFSEWIPERLSMAMVASIAARGYTVTC